MASKPDAQSDMDRNTALLLLTCLASPDNTIADHFRSRFEQTIFLFYQHIALGSTDQQKLDTEVRRQRRSKEGQEGASRQVMVHGSKVLAG
jgi:hypothetical protein